MHLAVNVFLIAFVLVAAVVITRARFGHNLFCCQVKRRTCESGRARTAGALAVKDLIGIALNILRLFWIEAEAVTDQLLEDRLVALALRVRA